MATKQQVSADELAVAAADEMFKAKGAGAMPSNPEGGLQTDGKRISESAESIAKGKDGEDKDYDKEMGDEDEEDEDKDDLEKTKKSAAPADESADDEETIDSDDLMKALSTLEATAEGLEDGAVDRRAELAERFASGDLSKAERDELVSLLGGDEGASDDSTDEPDLSKSVSEQFAADEQLARDYDVSEFIERQSQLMAKALDETRDGIVSMLQKSEGRQGDFNRALAKSFQGIGKVVVEQQKLIKSQQESIAALGERLGTVESTPLPRKARTGAVPLRKSFADQGAPDGGLQPAEILHGLETLMIKSRERGNIGVGPGGYDIANITAQYEQTRALPASVMRDVADALGKPLQLQ